MVIRLPYWHQRRVVRLGSVLTSAAGGEVGPVKREDEGEGMDCALFERP